jgi:lipoate-protein ligase A
VQDVLQRKVTWEEAATAMVNAFTQTLNIEFIQGELTERERERAHKLYEEKYTNPAWTERV